MLAILAVSIFALEHIEVTIVATLLMTCITRAHATASEHVENCSHSSQSQELKHAAFMHE